MTSRNAPELLKRWREANGVSLRKAALALGVSHVAYRAWELGTSIPLPEMRKAIAVWTHGEVPEDAWPLSHQEQKLADAAARVVPFEKKADDSASHAIVDADETG